MTETQIDIAEIKQTLKKIQEDVELLKRQQRKEDVYFNTWLDQYPRLPKANWTQEAEDEWYKISNNNPDFFSVCTPRNDEYVGGPVAGYCPDYMKGDK